jgi:hypothetical protein
MEQLTCQHVVRLFGCVQNVVAHFDRLFCLALVQVDFEQDVVDVLLLGLAVLEEIPSDVELFLYLGHQVATLLYDPFSFVSQLLGSEFQLRSLLFQFRHVNFWYHEIVRLVQQNQNVLLRLFSPIAYLLGPFFGKIQFALYIIELDSQQSFFFVILFCLVMAFLAIS